MSERISKYQELKKVIKNKNSPISLGCGMNCKIHVTSVVGGETVSPTDRRSEALPKKIPAFSLCIKDTGCGLKQYTWKTKQR